MEKSQFLVHLIYSFPGVMPGLTVTYFSGLSVAHVSGSNPLPLSFSVNTVGLTGGNHGDLRSFQGAVVPQDR